MKQVVNILFQKDIKMKRKILIVGAGLSGCTCARLLAEEGYAVSIVEKDISLGGLCRDMIFHTGNCFIHRYGPHIFHTKQEYIWNFVNRFSKWRDFHVQQMSCIDGKYYHFPINFNTIEEVYQTDVKDKDDVDKLIHDKKYDDPKNFEEYAINDIGTKLYEMFFKNYTEKQWKCKCSELPAEIYKRVGIRYNRDNDLFQNQFQGLPNQGYSAFLANLVDHPNISVMVNYNYDYTNPFTDSGYDNVIYTGGYEGLPYRCTRFSLRKEHYNRDYHLLSLPNDKEAVRRTNYTSMHPISPDTNVKAIDVCIYECPEANNSRIPCIPINTLENNMLYLQKRHEFMNLHPKAILIGRLSTYKYMNMDETIDQCFKTLSKENMIDASKYFK